MISCRSAGRVLLFVFFELLDFDVVEDATVDSATVFDLLFLFMALQETSEIVNALTKV